MIDDSPGRPRKATVVCDSRTAFAAPMCDRHPGPAWEALVSWKFREMIEFRDRRAADSGMELLVHVNRAGLEAGAALSLSTRPPTPTS